MSDLMVICQRGAVEGDRYFRLVGHGDIGETFQRNVSTGSVDLLTNLVELCKNLKLLR